MAIKEKQVTPYIFIGISFAYILHMIYTCWDFPFMDTMFDFLWIPEKFYQKKLTFGDFRARFVEHGMLGYNFLYLFNTVAFDLSMRFDNIVNTLSVIFCALISSILYCRTIKNRSLVFYAGFVFVMLAMFSPAQGTVIGMGVQVRLGITLAFAAVFYAERLRNNELQAGKSTILLYAFLLLSYFVFGTFYTFSWIAAISLVYVLRMIYGKISNTQTYYRDYWKEIIFMFICVAVYFMFYESNKSVRILLDVKDNPFVTIVKFFQFIVISIGGITIPFFPYDHRISETLLADLFIPNSILMTVITFLACLLFVFTKMWKKTLLPAIMALYSIITYAQIFLGRGRSMNDDLYAYNAWYIVHTKFLLAALIWIFIYTITNNSKIVITKSVVINRSVIKKISMCSILLMMIPFTASFIFCVANVHARVPHQKTELEYMKQLLTGEIALTSYYADGSTYLFNTPELTKRGIEILKKYRLNIFEKEYNNSYDYIITSGSMEITKSGLLIGNETSITLENKTASHFSLDGYYPENMPATAFTATINNKESATVDMIPGKDFNIGIDFENNLDTLTIAFKNGEEGNYINTWSLDDYKVVYRKKPHAVQYGKKHELGIGEIISQARLPENIDLLNQNTHNINFANINNGEIILDCGDFDPQFYLPLPSPVEKPAGKPIIEITYRNTVPGRLQVYFDYGGGLDDEKSSYFALTDTAGETSISLPVKGWNDGENLSGIRIDPPDGTEFAIKNIKIISISSI